MTQPQAGAARDPREVVAGLFDALVARRWDWSQAHSSALPELRQAVSDSVAGRLTEEGLADVARRCTGSQAAAETLAGQCRAVVRAARARLGGGT